MLCECMSVFMNSERVCLCYSECIGSKMYMLQLVLSVRG